MCNTERGLLLNTRLTRVTEYGLKEVLLVDSPKINRRLNSLSANQAEWQSKTVLVYAELIYVRLTGKRHVFQSIRHDWNLKANYFLFESSFFYTYLKKCHNYNSFKIFYPNCAARWTNSGNEMTWWWWCINYRFALPFCQPAAAFDGRTFVYFPATRFRCFLVVFWIAAYCACYLCIYIEQMFAIFHRDEPFKLSRCGSTSMSACTSTLLHLCCGREGVNRLLE